MKRARGELLSCGHESMVAAALIPASVTITWCPTCRAWTPRKPENVKADA